MSLEAPTFVDLTDSRTTATVSNTTLFDGRAVVTQADVSPMATTATLDPSSPAGSPDILP